MVMGLYLARLVGMEQRSYEKDGKQREYCGLHLMYMENSVEGVRGSKVELIKSDFICQ